MRTAFPIALLYSTIFIARTGVVFFVLNGSFEKTLKNNKKFLKILKIYFNSTYKALHSIAIISSKIELNVHMLRIPLISGYDF